MTTDERVTDLMCEVARMQGGLNARDARIKEMDERIRDLEFKVSSLLIAVEDMESAES